MNNLIYCFLGCLWGTMVGVLPGIGPLAGTAILIPLTFKLDPTGAIIMLAAIYYGSQYGGTITTILMGVPGEASSAITMIDGYQMAKQGRGGVALTGAAIGSFIGGTFATICLMLFAKPVVKLALKLGPPEYFALMIVGLSMATGLAGKSMVKALIMTVFGALLALDRAGSGGRDAASDVRQRVIYWKESTFCRSSWASSACPRFSCPWRRRPDR